jgi:hypothetical protein
MTYSVLVVDMFKAPLKESKHTVGGFATLELARANTRGVERGGPSRSNVVDTSPAPTRSKGGGFSPVKIARSSTIRSITRGCKTNRYVTPDERHSGREGEILARRHQLYQRVRDLNPERWTRSTRNWRPVGSVVLNPRGGSEAAAS